MKRRLCGQNTKRLSASSVTQTHAKNVVWLIFHVSQPVDFGNDDANVIGTSIIGSSEAIMLATLAIKKRWQNKRKAAGKPFDKPTRDRPQSHH